MGKRSKKSTEKKEQIKLKKEKQKLKSLKKKKKINNTLSDEDFDSICLYYENLNKKDKYSSININNTPNNTFVECEKPSPRSNSSVTFINDEEFVLFGGEYNDNNELVVYNDLFKYNVIKNKWKYYFSTYKKPKPRCSHQAVYFNKKIYIFGGELCTNTQFFHYNDFWSFDLKNNIFEQIETKSKKDDKPSPRSGHRMILWKNFLILFGGFFDNGKSIEYFNDLYLYIISSNKWVNLTNIYTDSLFQCLIEDNDFNSTDGLSLAIKSEKKNSKKYQILKDQILKSLNLDSYMPSKRSSVGLFTDLRFQKIYIYGGYALVKNTSRNSIGVYYNDLWILHINYMNEDNISLKFKKLKKSIFQPSKRIGYSICTYKNSLILFGGVFDKFEETNTKKRSSGLEEPLNMNSIFFNDLYLFNMNNEHWSFLNISNTEGTHLNMDDKENKKNEVGKKKISEVINGNSIPIEQESSYIVPKIRDKIESNERLEERKEEKNKNKNKNCYHDSDDSSYSGTNNAEDYYSNVFIYFDENGNKKTMKIEQEKTYNEHANQKKECGMHVENTIHKQIANENYKDMDKVIDNYNSYLQTEEPYVSNKNNKYKNANNTNDLEYAHNCKELENLRDLDEYQNIHDNKNIIEKSKENDIDENKNDTSNSDSDSNKDNKKKKFVINDIEPIGRINGHIFVINKNLYLYGGLYEYKNNEIILNDYWKINIFKRENWELIEKGNLDDIYVEESDSSSHLSIDDEDKDEKEIEDLIISSKIKKIENKIKIESSGFCFNVSENLNQFFSRTKNFWLNQINVTTETKQNRKDAFILCKQKYIQLKKHYNQIQKYKELLSSGECESSVTEIDLSDQETFD